MSEGSGSAGQSSDDPSFMSSHRFQPRSSDVFNAHWQSLEATKKFCKDRPWEQKFEDVEMRMRLNGETPAQMAFAAKIKEENADHSVDAPWEIDTAQMGRDRYVLITTVLMLAPKVILLTGPCFLATLPVVLCANLYGRSLPIPTDRWPPLCGGAVRLMAAPIMFVIVGIALLGLAYDLACHFVFGVVFWVCRGCPSLAKSFEAIRPFRNGPPLLLYIWRDVYCCLGGQSLRHYRRDSACASARGACIIAWHFTVMIMIMPTVKYWMCAAAAAAAAAVATRAFARAQRVSAPGAAGSLG